MKIKRFFAPDMRKALRQVRESLGPDAVILSNKSVTGGVELVAARDYDEAAFVSEDEEPRSGDNDPHAGQAGWAEVATNTEPSHEPVETSATESTSAAVSRVEWSQDPVLVEMRREMQSLRRMMENQLSELTWQDLGRRDPGSRELFRRLMSLDLAPQLCRALSQRVPQLVDPDQAWDQTMQVLAAELQVGETDLLEQGGVAAVVGPTGVGKTTTVAKLAARFCLRHGNRQLALITTDNFRIGAQEQLQDYAKILDVPVRTASNAEELNGALNSFAHKRLVLIDTAGMRQQDRRLGDQLAMLTVGHKPVHCFLTLSATTQQSSLELAIEAFKAARPNACILTKVDETASLGGVISCLIGSALPLAFTTDGQRVPEDLQVARADSLLDQAVALSGRDDGRYGDDYLAMALGGASGHAHV